MSASNSAARASGSRGSRHSHLSLRLRIARWPLVDLVPTGPLHLAPGLMQPYRKTRASAFVQTKGKSKDRFRAARPHSRGSAIATHSHPAATHSDPRPTV